MVTNMEQIDVVIACGSGCEGYVEFMLWTIEQTADHPERFRYLMGINADGIDEARLAKLGEIIDARSGLGYSSESHAITLDKTFAKVESRLTLILDCDVAFLRKGWDDLFISSLNDTNAIVGTAYDKDYAKKGTPQKYIDWPNAIACMFETEKIRALDLSFAPDSTIILDDTNALHYGLKPGDTVRRDTGCQLSSKLRAAGYTSTELPLVRGSEPETRFLNGLRGDEHQLNGEPILTHVGRSSSRKFGIHPITVAWETRAREWIAASK